MKRLAENERFQMIMSWIASVLVLAFFLLVTLGSYIKIKTVLVIVYMVVTSVLMLPILKKAVKEFVQSPLIWLWGMYCIVGLISTVFIARERDMYILISEISFTFILFVLTRYLRYEDFFTLFRIFVLVLVLTAFYQNVTGVLVFHSLKVGTQFIAEDITHGILSIFEYRHYFGCYILLAFFSLFFFPERWLPVNLAYGVVFLLAIVMTYTRSIWIALIIGMLLMMILALIRLIHSNRAGTDIKKKKTSAAAWIGVGIIVIILIALGLRYRTAIRSAWLSIVFRFTSLNPNESSWYNRFFTLINGPKYMFEHPWLLPVGGGAGSALKWLSEAEGARFRGAIDCQYVHTLMETGLSGLLVFLSMIVYSFVQFFRSKEKYSQLFSLTYLVIAVALFFFEAVVVNSSVYALWVFVLVSCCRKSEQYFCTAKKG